MSSRESQSGRLSTMTGREYMMRVKAMMTDSDSHEMEELDLAIDRYMPQCRRMWLAYFFQRFLSAGDTRQHSPSKVQVTTGILRDLRYRGKRQSLLRLVCCHAQRRQKGEEMFMSYQLEDPKRKAEDENNDGDRKKKARDESDEKGDGKRLSV
eukprot:scaffold2053_cov147-Amphora_coffeaeformis.AAC.2